MSPRIRSGALALALACTQVIACSPALAGEPVMPLPAQDLDPAKVALGRTLFHDTRMSGDGSLSCASCHAFPKGGADPRRVSVGPGGALGQTNALPVFNLAFQTVVNWDGRSASVGQLFERLVTNRNVIGGSWDALLRATANDPALAGRFRAIYPQGVSKENYIDAAVTYINSLATPSRFDRYLRGDASAISAQEKAGYEAFKSAGCASCHSGIAVGGTMMARMGVVEDYFAEKRRRGLPAADSDRGRFNVTRSAADMHVFKVPSLRNAALTAPYFHDGSAATLDEAVETMLRFQLGRRSAPDERRAIVSFLESLTAESLPVHP